jgi:protein gp37
MAEKIIVKRFSESNIEYLNRMWGIYSGCQNLKAGICEVKTCWAKGMVDRSAAGVYPLGFDMPTYYPEAADSPKRFKRPLVIGVGWVGDCIGYGLDFRDKIFSTIVETPQHNNNKMASAAYCGLLGANAKRRFISWEPLREYIDRPILAALATVSDWWTIGGQTQPEVLPSMEAVHSIVCMAEDYNIPVFLKNNLKPLFEVSKDKWEVPDWATVKDDFYPYMLRREFPAGIPKFDKNGTLNIIKVTTHERVVTR